MKEGINGANSHPPPCGSGQREPRGISKQLQELLPSPQAGTATWQPDQTQQQHLQDHGVMSNRTGQPTGIKLALTAGSQGEFSKRVLLKWDGPMVSHAKVEGPHIFSCLSALADARISKVNVCNWWERPHHCRRLKRSGKVERLLALGQTWAYMLVPSGITCAASSTWYLLWAHFPIYKNEDHTAYLARFTVNVRV